MGRTPPGTPPAGLTSPCSPHAPHSVHSEGSVDSGGSPHGSVGKGVAAPTTAVDDIAEKFGRPRAHSFSRQDRQTSLPALDEEGDSLSAYGMMEDRRRAVSMPAVIEPRRWRPSKQVVEVGDHCRYCRLAPCFAVKGERPAYCGTHKMVGMVSTVMEVCSLQGCTKIASYGFPSEGRQRCFTHKEQGMVHVLVASPEEDPVGEEDAAFIAPNNC
ncbi:unnamed protein product [Laminaria digitata]